MNAPRKLHADNFTPPARTPWGGTRIRSHYKADLPIAEGPDQVGESWEVSVEPSFPSRLDDGTSLADAIGADPVAWLGPSAATRYGALALLVKLLDADDDLSVQVHPADDDPALGPEESGKPEAWVVLEAAEGGGLYLGFREGVGEAEVAACLQAGGQLDELMTFVPVTAGDAFVIAAGTPHAIGRGVTLLEPQLVRPGKRGLTYRFWDWNRLYKDGKRDPNGNPRELHVERSLAVTRWDLPGGEAFVDACRQRATLLHDGPLRRERVIGWRWFETERWEGTGRLAVEATDQLWAVTCTAGTVALETAAGDVALARGESAVVPARAGALRLVGDDATAYATRLTS